MSGYRVGRMLRTYIAAAGAETGPWVHLAIAKAPNLSQAWDEAAVEDESSDDKRFMKGLRERGLTLTINRKIGDTQYKALRDCADDPDGVIGLAFCSGDIATVGEELFEADWIITDFPWESSLSETAEVQITAKLAANTTFEPTFSDVVAGP